MEKIEFIEKAKDLGLSEEYINETIKIHCDAEKSGIKMDYKNDLENFPTS